MATPFPFTSGQTLLASQLNAVTTLPISTKTASYTAVVGDVGSRIVMNVASANTVTINNSIFAEGDTIFIANKGAGTTTVTAGAGVTINGSSLTLAQHGGGTLVALTASVFTFFKAGGGTGYGVATGGIGSAQSTGTLADGFSYSYLTFNSTGTLTVTTAGFFDYLAIGGGTGSVSQATNRAGSGGGAGQVKVGSIYLDANQTITIGAGSTFINFNTLVSQATDTSIAATAPFAVIASGGRGSIDSNGKAMVFVGGGFGSHLAETSFNITGSTAIGFKGGDGGGVVTSSGGGGGSSGAGVTGGGTTGGAGGTGFDMSTFIGGTPSPTHRATGGGAGGSVAGGAGGNSSASSNAGTTNTTPNAAANNSGSGGGGGYGNPYTTGNGGSGVVFIRFR